MPKPKQKYHTKKSHHNFVNMGGQESVVQAPEHVTQLKETVDAELPELDSDQMNRDINKMVLAAKNGNWKVVWEILDTNPYVINMIPLERAWSALHQVVFYNHADALQKFLSYDTCDVFIRAKRDRNNIGELGITPRELAVKQKYRDIAKLLEAAEKEQQQEKVNFYTFRVKLDEDIGNPLFFLALTQYKDILLGPMKMSSHQRDYTNILQQAYKHQLKHWKNTQKTIGENMAAFTVNPESGKTLLQSAKTFNSFFGEVIQMYTGEDLVTYNDVPVYIHFNETLRMKHCHKGGASMLLSPYIVLFQLGLLFWDGMEQCRETTYRGLSLSSINARMYKDSVGKVIVWTSFTSSSVKMAFAKGRAKAMKTKDENICALCTISNSCTNTAWTPKFVGTNTFFPEEGEAIYPAGAQFKVEAVMYDLGGMLHIFMDLVGPVRGS